MSYTEIKNFCVKKGDIVINGSITEFMDKLYYGEELEFEYKSQTYFLQGWTARDGSMMVLDVWDDTPYTGHLWQCTKPTMIECAEEFLHEKLWDGKEFMDIQREVTWID